MASELSLSIAAGNWQHVVELAVKDPNQAQVWAARPGPLARSSGPYQIPSNLHGLPLHEAVCVAAPHKVIDILCRAYPEGLTKRDLVLKRLPLHIACHRDVNDNDDDNNDNNNNKYNPDSVILLLIQYYKTAVGEVDKNGRTPLHYALEHHLSDAVITACLDALPNVAQAQDKRGLTPLHEACRQGSSTLVITRLLQLHPDATIIKTDQGKGLTPVQFWKATHGRPEVVEMLKQYSVQAQQQFRTAVEPSSRRLVV